MKENTKWIITTFMLTFMLALLFGGVSNVVIEKLNSNISETLDTFFARVHLIFGNTKAAKNKLIKLITQYPESYIGHKWCNYWFHNEHLNDESGKMSKSKGDTLTVTTLENEKYKINFLKQ